MKIWDFDPSGNTWICTATWKSHFGSVWKVTWAHPEFGQVIATCSFDPTAAIWEEIPGCYASPSYEFEGTIVVDIPITDPDNVKFCHKLSYIVKYCNI